MVQSIIIISNIFVHSFVIQFYRSNNDISFQTKVNFLKVNHVRVVLSVGYGYISFEECHVAAREDGR